MATPVSTSLFESPVVLVADDDADTREMYRCYLTQCGFVVEDATDGCEAIARIKAVKPDIVVADITLPGVDGFEVCRQIRRDPRTASIPVIGVTGYSRPDGPERARLAGFDAFLLKPILPDQLLATIARLARRSRRIDRALKYR